jgi:hypothetical protein
MKEKPWHRRHAIQLAAQLPEGREDALAILDAARRLVTLPGLRSRAPKPAGKRRSPMRSAAGGGCSANSVSVEAGRWVKATSAGRLAINR